jgi:hypothetical protein
MQNTTPGELAAYRAQLAAMGLETQQATVDKQLAALGFTPAGKRARDPQHGAVPEAQAATPPEPAPAQQRKDAAEQQAAKGGETGKAATQQPPAGRHAPGGRDKT